MTAWEGSYSGQRKSRRDVDHEGLGWVVVIVPARGTSGRLEVLGPRVVGDAIAPTMGAIAGELVLS